MHRILFCHLSCANRRTFIISLFFFHRRNSNLRKTLFSFLSLSLFFFNKRLIRESSYFYIWLNRFFKNKTNVSELFLVHISLLYCAILHVNIYKNNHPVTCLCSVTLYVPFSLKPETVACRFIYIVNVAPIRYAYESCENPDLSYLVRFVYGYFWNKFN